MDPLHVLDILTLDHKREKVEVEEEDDEEEEDEMMDKELVRDVTDRMLASEGFSALAFLNVVNLRRDPKKTPEPPSLHRHRDGPSHFKKYEEAQTSSTKLHHVGDLLPLLPQNFVDDVSISLAHSKMPVSMKTAIQLVSDTVCSFNHIVLNGSQTLQTGFGESIFTRLLDLLEQCEVSVRSVFERFVSVKSHKNITRITQENHT